MGTQTGSQARARAARGVFALSGSAGLSRWSGAATGTGPKPPLTAGARLTMRSPSPQAQRALASSPSERAIFVFHLQQLCSTIKETSLRRRINDKQCLQLRREQVTIYSITRTATIALGALEWATRCPWGQRLTLHPPHLSVRFLSTHFAEPGSLPWLLANHMTAWLPSSVGEQWDQMRWGKHPSPSLVAFPWQTCTVPEVRISDLPSSAVKGQHSLSTRTLFS